MILKHIEKAEKKDKIAYMVVLGLFLLVGLFLFAFFFRENIVLVIIGFFIIILGASLFAKHLLSYFKREFPLMHLLQEEPQKVVWVYSVVTQRMPFGFQINQSGTMYFKLIDGGEMSLSFPASELRVISESLNDYLPHATFGYTKEREQWFMAHPELLIRNEK